LNDEFNDFIVISIVKNLFKIQERVDDPSFHFTGLCIQNENVASSGLAA
jgi:hypothetical protein